MGGHHLRRTGRTCLGGTGSPAEGVFGGWRAIIFGASCPAQGVFGASCNPMGDIIFGEPGAPAWGGRGVQPQGFSEPLARPMGGHHLQRTGRTGLGGTGGPA